MKNFRSINEQLAAQNARALWSSAVRAEQIAKITPAGWRLYLKKAQYLSALYRMAVLTFVDAERHSRDILLTARFVFGGQLHIYLRQLDVDIQVRISRIARRILHRRSLTVVRAIRTQNDLQNLINLKKGA